MTSVAITSVNTSDERESESVVSGSSRRPALAALAVLSVVAGIGGGLLVGSALQSEPQSDAPASVSLDSAGSRAVISQPGGIDATPALKKSKPAGASTSSVVIGPSSAPTSSAPTSSPSPTPPSRGGDGKGTTTVN